MAQIKPLFQDGTYVKTNDLNAITTYIDTIGAILGNLFQPGIIGGLQLTGAPYSGRVNGTISCTAGFAMLNSGKLVQFNAGDLYVQAVTFYNNISSSAVPVYAIQTGTIATAQRPNLVGQIQTVQFEDVFTLQFGGPPPTTTLNYFLWITIGQKISGSFINQSALPSTFVLGYNYALNSLQHLGGIPSTTSRYTGPLLDGTNAIVPGSITNQSLGAACVTTANIAPLAVTAAQIANTTLTPSQIAAGYGLIPTGTILPYAGLNSGINSGTMFGQFVTNAGFVLCDGSTYSIGNPGDKYYNLSQVLLGTKWNHTAYSGGSPLSSPGSGSFRVPDLRGLFLRGEDMLSGSPASTSGRDSITNGEIPGTYHADEIASEGVGPMNRGDKVEVEVGEIGRLINIVE